MCSTILQTVYIVGIVAAAGLTIASLVTPAWNLNATGNAKDSGSLIWNCVQNIQDCYKNSFSNLTGYQQAASALLIVVVIICAAAFIWALFTCCACCCHACLFPLLPVFSIVACGLNTAAIVVYAVNTNGLTTNNIGYSMWLAVVSSIILAADTVLSIFLCECCALCP